MERQSIYTIRVNTGNADKDVSNVTKSVDGLTKSTKAAATENKSFEERLKQVNDTVKAGEFSMRGANKLIQEYQQIAMQAGRESPVGREALLQAAQLQDKVTDLRNEVTRLSKDGQAMQGALAIGQTTLAGYSAFQGVTAMLGVENEKLMETMVKLQAAQAVVNSLEQVRAALEKESVLMLTLKSAKTKVLTAATAAYAAATGTATGALRLLRIALIATGLGAIVVAVGMLIANFDKLRDSVMKVINFAFYPYKKILQAIGVLESDLDKQRRKASEAHMRALQAETEQRRKAIDNAIKQNEALQKSTGKTYDFEIEKAKAAGKDTFDLEHEKRAEMRETLRVQLSLLEQAFQANSTNAQEMMRLLKQMANVREAITESEQQDEIALIRRKTDNTKKREQLEQEATKKLEGERAKQLEIQRKYEDLLIANIEDDNERTLMAMQTKHNRELEEIRVKYGEQTELIAELEAAQARELMELQDKQQQDQLKHESDLAKKAREERLLAAENDLKEALQSDLTSMQERFEQELLFEQHKRDLLLENDQLTAEQRRQIELDSAAKMEQINEQKKQDELSTAEAINMARMSVLQQSVAIIGQLAQLGKEGGAFAKAMALTEIAANTAIGFAQGLRIAQQSAAATGPGAAFAFPAFYAGQVAAVLAAANQARKVLSSAPNISGGGGGVSAPSVPQAQAPRNIQQGELTGTQQQESTTKVAVLESDITRTQQRIRDIEVRTTF